MFRKCKYFYTRLADFSNVEEWIDIKTNELYSRLPIIPGIVSNDYIGKEGMLKLEQGLDNILENDFEKIDSTK